MTKHRFLFYSLSSLYIVFWAMPAHAYLVPLIAGAGWLIAVTFGGIILVGTFIWLHVLKLKSMMKKKNKDDTDTQALPSDQTPDQVLEKPTSDVDKN